MGLGVTWKANRKIIIKESIPARISIEMISINLRFTWKYYTSKNLFKLVHTFWAKIIDVIDPTVPDNEARKLAKGAEFELNPTVRNNIVPKNVTAKIPLNGKTAFTMDDNIRACLVHLNLIVILNCLRIYHTLNSLKYILGFHSFLHSLFRSPTYMNFHNRTLQK